MKIKLLIIAFALLATSAKTHGQDDSRYFEQGGLRYRVIKEVEESSTFGTVSVCPPEFSQYSGDIVIPLTVKEFDDQYSDMYKVVSIDDCAFKDMPSINTIQLPISVETIGDAAFQRCGAEIIIIPTGNLYKIGKYAFSGTRISSLSLPSSVKSVGIGAFKDCENLESVNFGDQIRTIADSTFFRCSKLREFCIPKNTSRINQCAFLGCMNLRSLSLSDNVKYIGPKAFAFCSSLEELVLPDSICEIGWGAFMATSIYEITIPKNVKTLHKFLFWNSTTRKVNLNPNVSQIDEYAFFGMSCYKIQIPEGAECDRLAFWGTKEYSQSDKVLFDKKIKDNIKQLKSIVVEHDFCVLEMDLEMEDIDIHFNYSQDKYINIGKNTYNVIYSPEPGVEYGKLRLVDWDHNASGSIRVPDIIEIDNNGKRWKYVVTNIGHASFSQSDARFGLINWTKVLEHNKITSIEFGPVIEGFASSPFEGCAAKVIKFSNIVLSKGLFSGSAIENFIFPKGVEEIPERFFENCYNLKQFSIPNTVKVVGKSAFAGSALNKIDIPESVEVIKDGAFSDCQSLSKVSLPNNLKEIGRGAFSKTGLIQVCLPKDLQIIHGGTFSDCKLLSMVTLPKKLDGCWHMFQGCDNLRTIEFSQGTTIIPGHQFKDISSLEYIVIPSTVEEIEMYAFQNCGIRELILPNSIIKIGDHAFDGCTQLSRVVLPDSLTKIGYGAFGSCPIENIRIPKSVTDIGAFAFDKTKKAEIMCDPKVLTKVLKPFGDKCEVILNN